MCNFIDKCVLLLRHLALDSFCSVVCYAINMVNMNMKLLNAFCSRIAIAISKRNECPCNDKNRETEKNTSSLGSFNASHTHKHHIVSIEFYLNSVCFFLWTKPQDNFWVERKKKCKNKTQKKEEEEERRGIKWEWYLFAELLMRNALNACKAFATRFINSILNTHLHAACNLHAIRLFFSSFFFLFRSFLSCICCAVASSIASYEVVREFEVSVRIILQLWHSDVLQMSEFHIDHLGIASRTQLFKSNRWSVTDEKWVSDHN